MALKFTTPVAVPPPPAPALAFTPSLANYFEATSALVKSIRLRRQEDSVYWFTHLARFYPDKRFPLARRMFISSGEDAIIPDVQYALGDQFLNLLALLKADLDAFLEAGIAFLHTLNASPNWWANKQHALATALFILHENGTIKIPSSVSQIREVPALMDLLKRQKNSMQRFIIASHHLAEGTFEYGEYAEWLLPNSKPNTQKMLAHIVKFKKFLGNDSNHLHCMLVNSLLAPDLNATVSLIHFGQAAVLRAQALHWTETPRKVPSWCLDGIHTRTGSDERFAGIPSKMLALCQAYLRSGQEVTPTSSILPAWEKPESLAEYLGVTLPSSVCT